MSLINTVAVEIFKRRFSRIEENIYRNALDTQIQMFEQLIKSAKNTEWGKKYEYANIKNIEQFRKNVPAQSYEEFYEYIERSLRGEQNLLWSSPILCFSKSSGTTNARSKFIPVSQESLDTCHYRGGKDMLSLYVHNYPDTKLFDGKSLGIGGTYQQNELNPKTYYGDVSALIMKNLPIWAEFFRTPSIETALMGKWEEKIVKLAQESSLENVSSLAGVPTWTIVLIEKIVEMTGKKHIGEVWQNLEVFFHGAVSFEPYRELFKKLIPLPNMNYMETYNASEGFFALQDQRNSDELLLLLDYGVFYEFVPMEEWENPNPKTHWLDEVELHKNYALIISTNSGLWRYKIGDTVRFTSLNPYRIRISGRTKHFINAFGEEVVVENADIAIREACLATKASVKDFTAAPIYIKEGGKGGHEWLIEFEQAPQDMSQFTEILDKTLRQINSDYDAKRYMDLALLSPKVHHLPQGTFYNWLKKRNKLGGQNKVPRLSNTREYVDDILEML